ncbi:hypothetical protein ACE193_03770 [Bernardetia sp. OM2101]|uniref:hypothetical protein n=1 Tax=Bernardetia sp. OM2101 TaxID=3344876 RepID=UPI0035CF53E5
MNSELKTTIKRAYEIFGNYTISKPIDACRICCVTEEEENYLIETPLKKISRDALAHYQDSAQPKNLNLEETKYFLPRFLELVAEFDYPSHSAELSLTRVGHFAKKNWTEEEWRLLNEFMITFFSHYLEIYPPVGSEHIDSILIMFDKTKLDLSVLFKYWQDSISIKNTYHFIELIESEIPKKDYHTFFTYFMEKEISDKIVNWINSKHILQLFSDSIENMIMNPDNELKKIIKEHPDYNMSRLSWNYEAIQNKLKSY